jgi:hypothetical protein
VARLEVVGDGAVAGESDLDGGCGHRLELEQRLGLELGCCGLPLNQERRPMAFGEWEKTQIWPVTIHDQMRKPIRPTK